MAMELKVLGPTQLFVDGVEIPLTRVDRALLAALVYLPDGSSDSSLAEWAWDATLVPRALSSAKYRLRKLCGADALMTSRHVCRLNWERFTIDLHEFAALIDTSRTEPLDVDALQGALAMVRGRAFQSGAGPLWNGVRAAWEERIATYTLEICRRLAVLGRFDEAVPFAREACHRWPRREQAWLALVGVLRQQGRDLEAWRALEEARAMLAAAGMALPAVLQAQERSLLSPASEVAEASAEFIDSDHQLFGRRLELATVLSALRRIRTGRFAVAAVSGFTGMGTSSLLAAIVDTASRGGLLTAHFCCVGGDDARSSWLLPLARAVGHRPPAGPWRQADLDELFDALEAAADPVVVAIDDAEAMCASDRQALHSLLSCQPRGVLVIIGGQPCELLERVMRQWVEHSVVLGPLDDHALGEWLAAVGDTGLPVSEVRRLTGGVPLAVRALLRAWQAGGSAQRHGEVQARVMATRVATVTSSALEVLRVLMLRGAPMSAAAMVFAVDVADSIVHRALDELITLQLVAVHDERFYVVDDGARAAVAARTTTGERLAILQRLARLSGRDEAVSARLAAGL